MTGTLARPTLRMLLALAAVCLVLPLAPAALAQDDPSFRQAPPEGRGGTRLKPVCRAQPLAIRGGVLSIVSGKSVKRIRSEKLRGVATRLVTVTPLATELVMILAADGEGNSATAEIARKRAAISDALVAAGQAVAGWEEAPPPPGWHKTPPTRRLVRLRLAGDVDPLLVMTLLPAGLVDTVLEVGHDFPPAAAAIDPLRGNLEAAARADAAARASARGPGNALGERIDLAFSDRGPGYRDPRSGRRTFEVSAVATYLLSRPPGAVPFE